MAKELKQVALHAVVDLTKTPVEVLSATCESVVQDGDLSGSSGDAFAPTGDDLVALNAVLVAAHAAAKTKWGIL